MKPTEVSQHLNKLVEINDPKLGRGIYTFTAYILRILDNKKFYQAEIRNTKPPHEIYIVALDELKGMQNEHETGTDEEMSDVR